MAIVDTRNYGLLEGLPSARKLAGWVLNSDPENIFVNGTAIEVDDEFSC